MEMAKTGGAPPKRRFALRYCGNDEVLSLPMTTSRRGGGRAGDKEEEENDTKTTSGRDAAARVENQIAIMSRRHDLRRDRSGSMVVDRDENLGMDECNIRSDEAMMMFGREFSEDFPMMTLSFLRADYICFHHRLGTIPVGKSRR